MQLGHRMLDRALETLAITLDRVPAQRMDAYLREHRYPRLEALLADISGLPAPGPGGSNPVPSVDVVSYHTHRAGIGGWAPLLRERPRIAYLVAAGTIRSGSGARGVGTSTRAAVHAACITESDHPCNMYH